MYLYPLLFLAIFFAHYLIMPFGFVGLDAQRMLLVGTVISLLLTFSIRLRWKLAVVLIFMLGASCIIFDFIYNPYIKQLSYIVLLLGVILLLSSLDFHDEYIVTTFVICTVISFALVCICYIAFSQLGLGFNWKECFAFFSHPRFFNHFQVGTILFFPLLIIKSDSKFVRVAAFIALTFSFATIMVSAGRGIWIVLFMASLLLLLLQLHNPRRYFSYLIVGAIGGFAVYVVFCYLSSPADSFVLAGLEERGNVLVDNRSRIWTLTLSKILEKPFLGWGAYSYAFLAGDQGWLPAHPHQSVLQLAFEYGVLVAFAIVIFVGYAIFELFKRVRALGDDWAVVYFTSLIALAMNAQYSAVLVMPVGQMMVVVLVARLLNIVFRSKVGAPGGWQYMPSWLSICFIVIMSFASMVWIVVVKDYVDFRGEGEWNISHGKRVMYPRTWQDAS